MQVCTQHEWHITTGDPKTDADLKKDSGWTMIDIIQSKKEAPKGPTRPSRPQPRRRRGRSSRRTRTR